MFSVFPLFLQSMPIHMSLHCLSLKSMLCNYCSTYLSLSIQPLCLYMIPGLKCLTPCISIAALKSIYPLCFSLLSTVSVHILSGSTPSRKLVSSFTSSLASVYTYVFLHPVPAAHVCKLSLPTVSHLVVIYLLKSNLIPSRFCLEYSFGNKYALYMFLVVFIWTYVFTPVRYIHGGTIAAPYDDTMLSFTRIWQDVFSRGCAICISINNE